MWITVLWYQGNMKQTSPELQVLKYAAHVHGLSLNV